MDMMVGVVFTILISRVSAHGGLAFPPPRNNYNNTDPVNSPGFDCPGLECHWFNEGCWIGCETCTMEMPEGGNYWNKPECKGRQPMEPTLPERYRTWNIGNPSSQGDWTRYHPWRAPGYAPVVDPCGVAGAYKQHGDPVPPGSKLGDLGSKLPKLGVKTEWTAGGVAEVGAMMGTNHGGGYVYSLCPAGEPITEECFQRTTLKFVDDHHTIRYLDNGTQFDIPAMSVNEGTWPKGSTWRRNPIPACNCDNGRGCVYDKKGTLTSAYADGAEPQPPHLTCIDGDGGPQGHNDCKCPTGTQFPVPFDYGYGDKLHWVKLKPNSPDRYMWAVVDRVRVPEVSGDFVLRWRWDCEQTPQVWSHCADVTIVANKTKQDVQLNGDVVV